MQATKSVFPANSLSKYGNSVQDGCSMQASRPLKDVQGPAVIMVGAPVAFGGTGERLPRVFASQAISSSNTSWGHLLPMSSAMSREGGTADLRNITSSSAATRNAAGSYEYSRNAGQPLQGGSKMGSTGSTGRLYPPFLSHPHIHQATTSKPLPSKQTPVLRTFFASSSYPTVPSLTATAAAAVPGHGDGQLGGLMQLRGAGLTEPLPAPSDAVLSMLDQRGGQGSDGGASRAASREEGSPSPQPMGHASGSGVNTVGQGRAAHEGPFTSVIKDVRAGLNGSNLRQKPIIKVRS